MDDYNKQQLTALIANIRDEIREIAMFMDNAQGYLTATETKKINILIGLYEADRAQAQDLIDAIDTAKQEIVDKQMKIEVKAGVISILARPYITK